MGNKRNRRSRRLETPSTGGEENRNRADSPETGNITLTNSNLGNLGELTWKIVWLNPVKSAMKYKLGLRFSSRRTMIEYRK